jgi:ribosome-binding factor A
VKRAGTVPGRGPAKVPRTARVAEVVKQVLGEALSTGRIKDSRVAGTLITVTRVTVSGDLSTASVGVVAHGIDEAGGRRVLAGLGSASGILRAAIGAALGARVTPELHFRIDQEHDAESRIEQLLREDAASHLLRHGPAQEADPSPAAAAEPEPDGGKAEDE